MRHRAVFDMAARLHYLEPADLTQRARSAADSVLDRVLDALLRGTGDLDNPVNVIGHRHPFRGLVVRPILKTPVGWFPPAQPHLKAASTRVR